MRGRIKNHITNARKDYLHKLSTQLCKTHTAICVEDLKVKNLSRSAKGSVEKPGRNVKAKSKLNHAILDQGWGEFRRQLAYKTELNGGTFVAVPPTNTSRTCARAADTSPPATESVKRGSSASVAALKLTPTR